MSDSKNELTRRGFMKTGIVAVAGMALSSNNLMAFSQDNSSNTQACLKDQPASTGELGRYPYNGKGKVTLAKNMIDGINILTQAMINHENTIYRINYDFVLASNITIPKGCILVFDGGSISGTYTLKGNKTKIGANLDRIFAKDISISGTWDVAVAFPEWFGAIKDDLSYDNASAINKCQYLSSRIYLSNGTYYVSSHKQYGKRKCVVCIKNQCEIRGTGRNNTLIKYNGSDDVIVMYIGGLHSELCGFSIEGCGLTKRLTDVYNVFVTNGIGILLKDFNMRLGEGFVLHDIKVSNIEIGVRSSSFMTILEEVHCDRCHIGIDTFCAKAGDGGNALVMTTFSISNCYTSHCDIGYNLWAIRYSLICNSGADYNKLAYNISNADGVSLIGCGTEGVEKAIEINNCQSININGCRLGYGAHIKPQEGVIKVGSSGGVVVENTTIHSEVRESRVAIELLSISLNAVISLTIRNCRIDGEILNHAEWKNLVLYNNSVNNNNNDELNYISESFSNVFKKKIFTFNSRALDAMGYYVSANSGMNRPEDLGANMYSYGKSFFDLSVNKEIFWNGKRWVEGDGKAIALRTGKTSDRPKSVAAGGTLTSEDLGMQFFDTDLGKPVFVRTVNGKVVIWVDASGIIK